MQQNTHIEDGLRQRAGLAFCIECRQVGCGGVRVDSANIDPHDQMAVAEVRRFRSRAFLIWFVNQVKWLICVCREVAHLRPDMLWASVQLPSAQGHIATGFGAPLMLDRHGSDHSGRQDAQQCQQMQHKI